MHFLKKLGHGLSSAFLKLSLLVFALTFSFISVLGAPDNLKRAIKESNVYDQVVDSGLQSAAKDPEPQSNQIDMGSSEVKQAAKSAFPADTIELWGGQFIDGVYGWLEGKTEKPEFQIDTSAQQQTFAQNMANSVVQKVEGLRPCTRQESLELSRQNIDLFNLPCRPPINLTTEKERLVSELTSNSSAFGDDNVITSEDLYANTAGQEQFKNHPLPTIFQWSKWLPIIAATGIAISTLVILWLSDDKRRSIKKISFTLIGSGLVLIISAVLFGYMLNQTNGPLSRLPSIGEGSLQASVIEIIKSLFSAFNSKVVSVALIYVVLGLVTLLVLRFTKRSVRT